MAKANNTKQLIFNPISARKRWTTNTCRAVNGMLGSAYEYLFNFNVICTLLPMLLFFIDETITNIYTSPVNI